LIEINQPVISAATSEENQDLTFPDSHRRFLGRKGRSELPSKVFNFPIGKFTNSKLRFICMDFNKVHGDVHIDSTVDHVQKRL